jgi:hypothetical protein
MKNFFRIALILVSLAGCKNLEDAELTDRNTFIRFYEGANRFIAAEAVETSDGGFLIAGTIEVEGDAPSRHIWLQKTNRLGLRESDAIIIPDGRVSTIRKIDGGFAIVGDEVILSPTFSSIDDYENTASRLIILNDNGDIREDISFSQKDGDKHVDFHATGLAINGSSEFITLGTRKHPDQQEKASITAIDAATMDTLWQESFDYINRNYANTRALFYDNGKILWGSSITETVNNFTKSYLSIPVIMERSTFVNSNYFGQENTQNAIKINDLKKYNFGYAAVGTFSETDGNNSNMFFITIDDLGNFQNESIRYYDGASLSPLPNGSTSTTDDSGEAMTPTRDGGFVLAGSSVNLVRGGKDVWLLKIDSEGEIIWSKSIGGRYTERVSSITETSDGSLVICGTSFEGATEAEGLASIFLIKTDANGNLND